MGDHKPETTDAVLDAICRFAGHLAHEINNMLTPIVACGQMLKDGLDRNDPHYFCAEQVYEGSERLLTFSRKLQVIGSRRHYGQLGELASMVFEAARAVELPADSGISVELPSGVGNGLEVTIDGDQLMYLVRELIENAAAAMPDGGTIRLSVEAAEAPDGESGEWVGLTVADDGAGMDGETMAHMYEPYFTTAGRERDRGLGLTLVYGIVRRAGGVIECTSAPGRGTSFCIRFPRGGTVAAE